MTNRIRFGIAGAGWRAEFFLRIAKICSDRFEAVGITSRSADNAAMVGKAYNVPAFNTVEDMITAARPQFVVTSIPRDVNPQIIRRIVDRGVAVLSETPPAGNVQAMEELWELTQAGAKIQVAEQYCFQPQHAARLAFARGGKLGQVSQAQVSVAHAYHGISVMRQSLGINFENAKIKACRFESPIIEGPGRAGPPPIEKVKRANQETVRFDFGDRLGITDFTGDQYFSWIRGQRLLVRGDRGEIINDTASYLKDFLTPIRVEFFRHVAGPNGNLEGHHLKGIQAGEEWIYRNPLAPSPLSDDEIAIGTCLLKMGEYVETNREFYSLASACQDQYLALTVAQALTTGEMIETQTQRWA